MDALQTEQFPPSSARMAQRVKGFVTLALVVTTLLAAGWSAYWWVWTWFFPAGGKALLTFEWKPLPGSPDNVLSAQLKQIDEDEARSLNAAIPFARTAGWPAPPFHFAGSFADRIRATDCLALAAMAEAGYGDDGQRAVIQVVLNRLRHPAFAKTVCGVVFQGSHRATGCQFTFTCDGSLARRYSAASWASARSRASQALDGLVYAPVGLATHYHTDWVHPYWSSQLSKLARVDTHLFFRWPGQWGNAALLSVPYGGGEPAISQLAYLPSHAGAAEALAAQLSSGQYTSDGAFRDMIGHDDNVVVRNPDGGAFVLLAGAPLAPAAREMGRRICMDRPYCKVFGWFSRSAIPGGYPVPPSSRAELGFSYFRDARKEIVLYDCSRFTGVATGDCISISRKSMRARAPVPDGVLPAAPGSDRLSTSTSRDPRPQLGLGEFATRAVR